MNEPVDSMELRLRRGVQTATLCAYYGGLLTDKQRTALRLHYEDDLSLGEIADELHVTRQNVHELISRSEDKLRRYERKLGCAARAEALAQRLGDAQTALEQAQAALAPGDAASAHIASARQIISDIITQQEGEDDEHGV